MQGRFAKRPADPRYPGGVMIEHTTIHRRDGIAKAIGILSAVYATTFFFGALLHLGVKIPLGFAVVEEPVILPATIVEGLCGTALAVAAFAVLARRELAWPIALAAHAFALGGVLLGITALALGAGPSTALRRATSPTVIQSR